MDYEREIRDLKVSLGETKIAVAGLLFASRERLKHVIPSREHF
jgi:hypothetical protein